MKGKYSNTPCTKKGYKKISITLAILEEFLVISLFHETKILTVDKKVQVHSNFSKNIWKKTKSPSSMKNGRFCHPSIGASFKKWRCCTPILSKC
jgi:hypothetical protein